MFIFFNDTATTEIYTLSLHDALPIYAPPDALRAAPDQLRVRVRIPALRACDDLLERQLVEPGAHRGDRKSTRLNSSHANISYAVFCLKKKKMITITYYPYFLNFSSST